MATRFFEDPADEEELEARNEVFWEALIGHVRRDGWPQPPKRVLDVGCHRGGLLAKIGACWGPDELTGIEPLEQARMRAKLRLTSVAPRVTLLDPSEWGKVADRSMDLVVSHEVLFLLPNLEEFAHHLARVLAPNGRAYVAAGCHAENPVWPTWRAELEAAGRATFTHEPMALMAAGAKNGLLPSVRPLRTEGWATHDPTSAGFTFPSVGALLDHQFRFKLLFRFVRA